MKLLFQLILPTVLISSSVATPAPNLRDTRRTAPLQPPINCTYAALQKNPRAACWNQLDLTSYLTGWNKTTPTCSNDSFNDADCCRRGEAWASCFQRLATGTPESCQIGSLHDMAICYEKSLDLRTSLDSNIVDQVGYVLRTIQNINDFFFVDEETLFDSLGDLMVNFILRSDLLPKIDPSDRTILSLANMIDALDLGLPFLSSPSILPPSTLTDPTLLASHSLVTGITSSPAVARALFFLSTPSKTNVSVAFLSSQDFAPLKDRLTTSLSLLMTDLPTFTSFATNGSFSSSDNGIGFRDSQPHLTLALSTHIVSELLSQNDWFGVPLNVASHADFAASCGAAAPVAFSTNTTVCQTASGEATFWSPITQRIFALRYQGAKDNQKLSPIEMLNSVQNYTAAASVSTALGSSTTVDSTVVDMPTLFDGAWNCTAEGKAGGGVVNINAGGGSGGDGTGTLDVSCLSRLPIYLPCKTACPTSLLVGGKCPFGFTGKGC